MVTYQSAMLFWTPDQHRALVRSRRDPYGRDIFGFHAAGEIDRESFGLVWNVLLETGGFLVGKKIGLEIAGEAIRQA